MAAVGISPELIAKRIGCTVDELENRYEVELRRAGPEALAMVGASLFAAAKAGNVTAQIFWLKTRAGWKETVRREVMVAKAQPKSAPLRSLTKEWPMAIPCNGRGTCPKITDPAQRKRHYELVLDRKLD
jgi:hypothetical protein